MGLIDKTEEERLKYFFEDNYKTFNGWYNEFKNEFEEMNDDGNIVINQKKSEILTQIESAFKKKEFSYVDETIKKYFKDNKKRYNK